MSLTNTVGGEQSTAALGDKVMLGSIAFCAVASLIVGWSFGEIGMAMGLSVLLLLLGGVAMAFDSQGKARRSLLTFVLVAFVALHIQLSRGMLEFHFGVFVVLAILLVYLDWTVIALGAALFAIHHIGFDRLQAAGFGAICLSKPDFSIILLHALYVVLQAGIEILLAVKMGQAARQGEELGQLVASVNHDAHISLDVRAVNAQTVGGQALKQTLARMETAVGMVRSGAYGIEVASAEIASGNQDLSMRTEQTAANLQQTSASMAQITATVTQSVQTAEQANLLAGQSAQAAQRGSAVMEQVVSSMARITESSRKINDIIGVIDGIAFQTNILALNAAVEAARAGEQGRGFAVVASEVRALAGRSADAAKEIKALIGSSVDTVQTGSAQVAEAGQTMSEIVEGARRVSALISDITTAANEQRDGITQVNVAVTQLDQMTQQNAALVEESAAAAASLREQAGRLEQVISVFDVGSSARHLGQKLLHQPSLSHQTSLA